MMRTKSPARQEAGVSTASAAEAGAKAASHTIQSYASAPERRAGLSYKTVLVQVEPGEEATLRLRFAVELAQQFSSWLIGVCARSSDSWPDPTGISQRALKRANAVDMHEAETSFRWETRALGERAVWLPVEDSPADAVAKQAFSADLVVPNRSSVTAADQMVGHTEDLTLRIAAPVLWIPPSVQHPFIRRVVVGWKNTKEGCRAVWDAMPFLKGADAVRVARVVWNGDGASAETELAQLVERLRRHRIRADGELRFRRKASIAEELIDVAHSLSAELIVAGASSHSRLHERILGGVTQELLATSPKLVLLSH